MKLNNVVYKEIDFAGRKLSLETGKLASMTNMAVKASFGDTVVLVTAVAAPSSNDTDFFPLTINYQEKFYASGIVKSSRFVKREGRATDEAIIAGRVIDHAIRPLFPKDYMDEVQLIATVLSLEPDNDPEFLSMIAASAAVHASDIPFNGPMTTAKVAYVNGDYVMCPTKEQLENSDLHMMVSFAGEEKRFLAVEADAEMLPEEKMLGAIEFAHNNLDPVYNLIVDFAKEVNPEGKKYAYLSKKLDETLVKDVREVVYEELNSFMRAGLEKDQLEAKLVVLFEKLIATLSEKYKKSELETTYYYLEKEILQEMILTDGKRPDGRGITDVRKITCEVGVLPRTHGSGLFTRGITQVLTTATLASPSEELLIQDMYGERSKKYIHYYNFPPFASGETGKMGWPKNREIGHGALAEKALIPAIPSQKEFPYMILLVSETMSSSGSTSMAATCGSTLALMDAGVPIKDMVGGVGVGLIANDDFSKSLVMTDLAYMEDAFGMMDFKMTGTRTGITAIQCDMKVPGLPMSLLPKIFEQSKAGRMHVLDQMEKVISAPRAEVSKYAPKTTTIKIDVDKIGVVIGAGGKKIKEIQEKTGSVISIEEDGTVVISAADTEKVNAAAAIVEGITKDVKAGEIYEGVVEEVVDFGAFVEFLPGKVGLLHISEISNEFVKNIHDVIKAGDTVRVKVLEVTRDGKFSLSKKALELDEHKNSN